MEPNLALKPFTCVPCGTVAWATQADYLAGKAVCPAGHAVTRTTLPRLPDYLLKVRLPSLRTQAPEEVAYEVLRGAQRFPNPFPPRHEGGDCFACAGYAMVKCLFPDKEVDWDALYEAWFNPRHPGQLDNTWERMRDPFQRMGDMGYPMESGILFTAPFSSWNLEAWEPAWFRANHEINWWRDIHAYLSAGWLALSHVKQKATGPTDKEGFLHNTNHVVLIDGARQAYQEVPQPAWYFEKYPEEGPTYKRWEYQVHVVDSARTDMTGWHEVRDWLHWHGASAVHIFRRNLRPKGASITTSLT